jgi:hypothetical protein
MTAYQIDLDPVHAVIHLTVTAEDVTLELAEDIYTRRKRISSSGGPHAAIYDLSAAKCTSIPTQMVRDSASLCLCVMICGIAEPAVLQLRAGTRGTCCPRPICFGT